MAASLSATPKLQFFDANGNPLVGGKLYTYAAGTTTLLASYTDSTGTTPAANPITLDSRGECTLWLGTAAYKLKLTNSANVEIWVVDNVSGVTINLQNAQGILPIASGGTGESVAANAFNNLKQPATSTYSGVVELATSAEVIAGTDTTRAVTPAGLASVVASTTLPGLVELATDAEAQTGTDTTRAITPANLLAANVVASTVTATTSGTSVTLTGTIPSTAKRVTVILDQVSTSGTSPVLVQLGTSGPVWVTSGYSGTADNAYGTPTAYTAGMGVERTAGASGSRSGILVLNKITANTWVANYTGTNGTDMCLGASRVALAAALTNVRLTTVGGTDTFDAGQANLFWE